MSEPDSLSAPEAEHRPAGVGARIAFALALLVITLPFAIMVPWQLHGGRNAIAEVAAGSEAVLLALVFAATSLIGRHARRND